MRGGALCVRAWLVGGRGRLRGASRSRLTASCGVGAAAGWGLALWAPARVARRRRPVVSHSQNGVGRARGRASGGRGGLIEL